MTKYPNSECAAHRNVETNAPVCIVCMDIEIARLREALETIASFAPGNGDVCEIIAQRARQALTPNAALTGAEGVRVEGTVMQQTGD